MESRDSEIRVAHHWMCQRLGRGLDLLLVASQYGQNCECDKRQLSVRLDELTAIGIEITDCRWMIVQGLLEHFSETTYPGDKLRSFRSGDAILSSRSSFLLTREGAGFATELVHRARIQVDSQSNSDYFSAESAHEVDGCSAGMGQPDTQVDNRPKWDVNRQELWFRGQKIKQYRIPSPNQVAILSAFEEEAWPSRVDDPLPQHAEIDPRRRLNDTIRNLNRSRIHATLRFSGDGSGQGVLWEPDARAAP